MDQSWWKAFFDRKLELEREKMKLAQERHRDNMNFQKMALMLQERVEKVKVEAINSLTSAIAKLAEAKHNKWKQLIAGCTIKVLQMNLQDRPKFLISPDSDKLENIRIHKSRCA